MRMQKDLLFIGSFILLSACQAPPSQPPPSVSQLWSSSSSSANSSIASSQFRSSSASSIPTDAVGDNEATPSGTESLEIPVDTGATMTGHLSTGLTSIQYGDAPGSSAFGADSPAMEEYFDYDCEYCRQYARTERLWVEKEFVATRKIRIERNFLPMTPAGEMMAAAALCAAHQNKYEAMDGFLLARVPQSRAIIEAELKTLGIDRKAFGQCMSGPGPSWVKLGMETDQPAEKRVPAFRIGSKQWLGILPRQELQKTIDEALRQK